MENEEQQLWADLGRASTREQQVNTEPLVELLEQEGVPGAWEQQAAERDDGNKDNKMAMGRIGRDLTGHG